MKSAGKVVYISNPFYLDYDLSLIRNLSKIVDIYYFLDISPISSQATILKIDHYVDRPYIGDETTYNLSKLFHGYLPVGKTFIINRRTNKPSKSNLKLQFSISKLFNQIAPDILHFNTDINHNYFLIPSLCKMPIVYTVHDPLPHSDDDRLKERLKRKLFYPLVKNFIILNNDQRNVFIKRYHLKNKNVFVLSLGIYEYLSDRRGFSCRDHISSSENSIKIIFFGRINKYKGVNYLLEAFEGIVKKYPKTELVIAGKGYLPESYIEPPENVTFINRYIFNDELSDLITDSDFVVCPYLDATQSGVIMTAFAFAKPVIATNVGGLKEYVEDGITGLLIKPKDIDQLKDSMERLINNPDLINNMSKNIYNKYHFGEHSWEDIAKHTVNIYNKVL